MRAHTHLLCTERELVLRSLWVCVCGAKYEAHTATSTHCSAHCAVLSVLSNMRPKMLTRRDERVLGRRRWGAGGMHEGAEFIRIGSSVRKTETTSGEASTISDILFTKLNVA